MFFLPGFTSAPGSAFRHLKFCFSVCTVLLLAVTASAQKKLPIIRAGSKQVTIKEGISVYKNAWTLSPETKPDIFITNPFTGQQEIRFYTDVDSISFNVKPNRKYDFIILLNGKDTAYTQINTYTTGNPTFEPKLFYMKKQVAGSGPDTIPFRLGKDNGIHISGTINGSDTVDFLFDTNAGGNVIATSTTRNKVKLKIDGTQQNGGIDGVATVQKSNSNKIDIAGLTWDKVPLMLIDYQNESFDAVFSWLSFENRIVEINYDKNLLIIYSKIPNISADYRGSEMKMIGGIPYIKCSLSAGGKESEGWFGFDTGSDGTLFAGQKFAAENALNGRMEQIGIATSQGSAGVAFQQQVVLLPKLKIGGFELYRVPLLVNEKDPEGVEINELAGNSLLKKFNVILDFQNNYIYLKPNKLFYTPM